MNLDEKGQKKLINWILRNHPGQDRTVITYQVARLVALIETPDTVKGAPATRASGMKILCSILGVGKINEVAPLKSPGSGEHFRIDIPGFLERKKA